MAANCVDDKLKMDQRYIKSASNAKKMIKSIIQDDILFSLADPESNLKLIQEAL